MNPAPARSGLERPQIAQRCDVPRLRDVPEHLLDADRHLDVGERVAAQRRERVASGKLPDAEHLLVDRVDRVAGWYLRRDVVRPVEDRLIVGLAARKPRHVIVDGDIDRPSR